MQRLLLPALPLPGLLTLVNGSSNQPQWPRPKAQESVPDPSHRPMSSPSAVPLAPPTCMHSASDISPPLTAPRCCPCTSTSACPVYSLLCSSEVGSFKAQARSHLWFCSKPSCGLHFNKVKAKVWIAVRAAFYDLNPIPWQSHPVLHFPSSILLQPATPPLAVPLNSQQACFYLRAFAPTIPFALCSSLGTCVDEFLTPCTSHMPS